MESKGRRAAAAAKQRNEQLNRPSYWLERSKLPDDLSLDPMADATATAACATAEAASELARLPVLRLLRTDYASLLQHSSTSAAALALLTLEGSSEQKARAVAYSLHKLSAEGRTGTLRGGGGGAQAARVADWLAATQLDFEVREARGFGSIGQGQGRQGAADSDGGLLRRAEALMTKQHSTAATTPAAPKVAPLHLYGAAAAAAAAAGSLMRPAPRPPGYVATMRMEDMLRAAMAAAEVAEGTPGGERAAEGGGAAGVRSEFANVLQVLLTMATATWYSLWPLLLGTHLWPLLLRYLLWPLLLRYLL